MQQPVRLSNFVAVANKKYKYKFEHQIHKPVFLIKQVANYAHNY